MKKDDLRKLKELRDTQGVSGNWDYDEYMRGLYNGLELALSVIEDREPIYKESPETESVTEKQADRIQKMSEIIYDFEHTEFEIDVARYSTMAFSGSSDRENSPAIQAIIMDSVTELNGEEFIGKRLKVRLVHPQVEYPWKEKDIEAISFEDI